MANIPPPAGAARPVPPAAPAGVQPPVAAPVPPMAPPQPAAPAAVAAATPPSSGYVDLSLDMQPHWQIVDWAHRQLKKALKTQGFYKEGEARAQLVEYVDGLEHLIARYAHKKKPTEGPSAGPTPTSTGDDMEFSDDAGSDATDTAE